MNAAEDIFNAPLTVAPTKTGILVPASSVMLPGNAGAEDAADLAEGIDLSKLLGSAPSISDDRSQPRYRANLKTIVVNDHADGLTSYHGSTHDIAMRGFSFMSDHNLSFSSHVTALIELPPVDMTHRRRLIEVKCCLIYTVLAASVMQFRTGFVVHSFKGEGKQALGDYLKARFGTGI